jgi:hypothetical protein
MSFHYFFYVSFYDYEFVYENIMVINIEYMAINLFIKDFVVSIN